MKKLFAMILAIVLVLSLAACGGNSDDSGNTGTSGNAESAAKSKAPVTPRAPAAPKILVTVRLPRTYRRWK